MPNANNQSQADIRILGVGGGGGNALETMIREGIQGVQFIAVNTDGQALENSSAEHKIQLGAKLTKGLGAGADPEIGRRAGIESYEEIVKALQGADMVFVTAGMGGGTGTGAAPLVAQAADELGLLTVGIVTKPFLFEGPKRMKQAEKGIRELRNYVDTLIVAPNEKLLHISQKAAPLLELFKVTDDVLLNAVKGIAELVSVPGLVNLDFADIRTVMLDKGLAIMGRGIAEGSERAEKAVREAVSSPLLSGMSIQGATGMIVNITANSSLSLMEVQSASSALTAMADGEADIVIGAVIDENMKEKLSVTVIATGFEGKQQSRAEAPRLALASVSPEEGALLKSQAAHSIEKPLTKEEQKPSEPSPLRPAPWPEGASGGLKKLSDPKPDLLFKAHPFSESAPESDGAKKQAPSEEETSPIEGKPYESLPLDSSSLTKEPSSSLDQKSAALEAEERNGRADSFPQQGPVLAREETQSSSDSKQKSSLKESASAGEARQEPFQEEESPCQISPQDTLHAGDDQIQPSFDRPSEGFFKDPSPQTDFQEAKHLKEGDLGALKGESPSSSAKAIDQAVAEKNSFSDQSSLGEKPKPAQSLEEEKLSPREMLLKKIKDYAQNQTKNPERSQDNQLSMDWRESSFHQEPSSPFESALEFSDEEMGLK